MGLSIFDRPAHWILKAQFATWNAQVLRAATHSPIEPRASISEFRCCEKRSIQAALGSGLTNLSRSSTRNAQDANAVTLGTVQAATVFSRLAPRLPLTTTLA
jgi:hypothetical protein